MAYGMVYNAGGADGGFDYLAGVEVAGVSPKLADYKNIKAPAQKYAIFCHRGHVSRLKDTISAIWQTWVPTSGHTLAKPPVDSPNLIEYYAENFDPETGLGDMEVWVAIKS